MKRQDLEISKSSPIGPSDSVKTEIAFPIGCIMPGGFGPGLGTARVGKSRAGGAERSGHLSCRSPARSVAMHVFRWGQVERASIRAWRVDLYPRGWWVFVCITCISAHICVSLRLFGGPVVCVDSVSSGALITLTQITSHNWVCCCSRWCVRGNTFRSRGLRADLALTHDSSDCLTSHPPSPLSFALPHAL